MADSSRAAARWTLRCTHCGEVLGIPPTGRQLALTGIDYFRLTDNKIAELWRSFDIRALIQQLTLTEKRKPARTPSERCGPKQAQAIRRPWLRPSKAFDRRTDSIYGATRNLFSQQLVDLRWRTTAAAILTIGVGFGWAGSAIIGGSFLGVVGFQGLFLSLGCAGADRGHHYLGLPARWPAAHGGCHNRC